MGENTMDLMSRYRLLMILEIMLQECDDYMRMQSEAPDEEKEIAVQKTNDHFNGLFYHFVTKGDTELTRYSEDIDVWLNSYIFYRDFSDSIKDIEMTDEYAEEVGNSVRTLSHVTHRLRDRIQLELKCLSRKIQELEPDFDVLN